MKNTNFLFQRLNFFTPFLNRFFSQNINNQILDIPIERVRNFCIVAHIDHGKSTLADRLLELTGTISKISEKSQGQVLDRVKVERERGITIKAKTASMIYEYNGLNYLLNLIDTPGHVDFTFEVSRSLRVCQGTILLVDSTKGIQAQTLSNYMLAKQFNLQIIPVINKIDLESSDVNMTLNQMKNQFDFNENQITKISAKSGLNCGLIIPRIINEISPPPGLVKKPFRAFVIDSWYMKDKGVVLLVLVLDGEISKGKKIQSSATGKAYDIFDVGVMIPHPISNKVLQAGQVGYIITTMKTPSEAHIGDTIYVLGTKVQVVPGYKKAKIMVYASLYPEFPEDYENLSIALKKLSLEDPSVTITNESSAALGNGFRCGFLGMLHMEVFRQRVEDDFSVSTIVTNSSVPYKAKLRNGKVVEVENANSIQDVGMIDYWEEPWVDATLLVPKDNIQSIFSFCRDRRGIQTQMNLIDENRYVLKYEFPMSEIITDFFDKLKSLTSGYGSLDYDFKEFRKGDVKRLTILIAGDPVDALSFIVHETRLKEVGDKLCTRLKESIPRQLFQVSIQAKIEPGNKIISREDLKAMRKDVTAKCYGGDYSRKKKLLERQKEGKKRMRMLGQVEVTKDVFISILKNQIKLTDKIWLNTINVQKYYVNNSFITSEQKMIVNINKNLFQNGYESTGHYSIQVFML